MNLEALKNTLFENINYTDSVFTKHFHDTYTIGITNSGMFKSINQNKTFLSYKNSTRVINPAEVHGGVSSSWNYTNFYPSVELVSNIYEQIFFEKKIPLFEKHIINDIYLYHLLYELFSNVYYKKNSMQIEIKLIEVLSYLIKNYTHCTKNHQNNFDNKQIIFKTIEYIKDTKAIDLSLDDLSQNVNLSKYHFLRIFKQHLGITPHNYIVAYKIQRAKELITKGNTLSDVSLEVGFSDQSHFIRNFKKIYGYTPNKLINNSNIILY